ncbi:MAG: DUF1730 domain-containing protein [Bacteroidaceae bacterium]|nr:DUF1730 domain-containing protein [Bacteroidaceae bacterium]
MGYLQRNGDKRTDPRLLVPGCCSIVCVALNYCPRPQDIVKGHNLSKEKYNELFTNSAVERCGYEQLVRNISACKK